MGRLEKAVGSSRIDNCHSLGTFQPVKLYGGSGASLASVVPDLHLMRCPDTLFRVTVRSH